MPNVLLVEDNPMDAKISMAALHNVYADAIGVIHVTTLREAQAAFVRTEVDVVILDLMLPDSTGFDSLRAMREISGDLPIIVVTGMSDQHARLQAIVGGALQLMGKDESMDQLPAAVAAAIEERRRSRSHNTAIQAKIEAIATVLDTMRGDVALIRRTLFECGSQKPSLIDQVHRNTAVISMSLRLVWGVLVAAAAGASLWLTAKFLK